MNFSLNLWLKSSHCLLLFFVFSFLLQCVGEKKSTILRPDAKDSSQQFDSNILTIKAVGDVIPGTNFPDNRLINDTSKLFENVSTDLKGADILFGNYEATLTDYPKSSKNTNRPNTFAFRLPPEYGQVLKDAGFDILSVVNNHSYDFTEQGFVDTMKNINESGMIAVGGKNQVQYTTVKGIKIAFIGFGYQTYHNSINDFASAELLVKEADANADLVVLSIHAGGEGAGFLHVRNEVEIFLGENRGNLVSFTHKMIDFGADLVLGHGPHVPRAMELYKDRLIAYSMGNFLGYRTLRANGVTGMSMILSLALDRKGRFLQGSIIPVEMKVPGIPYLDPSYKSVELIRKLTKEDFPSGELEIDERGSIYRSSRLSWNVN
ncbi:MAG: CapA family protein [Leptospira sp.]|nr:CapA family protein [Leptospira sp.]NCS92198.1 CapA family protein [Leptospira sp.]